MSKPLPTRTENGMATFVSSNDPVTDLFYHIGAMRGKDVIPLFTQAFNTDPILATKVALWARDVRGGAGERKLFRDILTYLEKTNREVTLRVIDKIPELGRWDDMLVFSEDYAKSRAYSLIRVALAKGDGLCAKWMPRQGEQAVELRNAFGWTPKRWRKTLVSLSNTVEQQMCAKDWNGINFDHVPSVAAARYQKAFKKNATEAYGQYVSGLQTGERKINVGAVYPYDITKSIVYGNAQTAVAQWEALPNFVGNRKVLPVIDTSPSMRGHSIGDNLTAMDVAIGLGLYFADKNTGAFNGVVSEFSGSASLHVLQGNILAKLEGLRRVPVDYTSTNLHAAFAEILNHATRHRVPAKDMPEMIVIFSDMQFNGCVRFDDNAIQMIRRQYANHGYTVPKVIFWNVASRSTESTPVLFNEKGVALVSGFSPAVFKSIASGRSFTPRDIMLETINKPRYAF
jgi:hypothetical protein